MANKLNQIVKVNTVDATSSVSATSINTVAICVVKSGTIATEEFYDLDGVVAKYGTSGAAYEMAKTLFSQTSRPASVVIIACTSLSATDIESAVNAAAGSFDFFTIIAEHSIESAASLVTFAKALNTYATRENKMVVLEVDLKDNESALATAFDGEGGLTASGTKRVAIFAHDTTNYENEHLGVAMVANRCGGDPARGTWAHKGGLVGVTPDKLSVTQFANAKKYGYNVYTLVAGVARLFMGTTCGPKDFIDTIYKIDWIKFRSEEAVYALLGDANEGYGVTYDDTGIQSIAATICNVLTEAASARRQYIMEGYEVDAPRYSEIEQAEKDKRNVPGIVGSYSVMNFVHSVLDVTLNLVYATTEE